MPDISDRGSNLSQPSPSRNNSNASKAMDRLNRLKYGRNSPAGNSESGNTNNNDKLPIGSSSRNDYDH